MGKARCVTVSVSLFAIQTLCLPADPLADLSDLIYLSVCRPAGHFFFFVRQHTCYSCLRAGLHTCRLKCLPFCHYVCQFVCKSVRLSPCMHLLCTCVPPSPTMSSPLDLTTVPPSPSNVLHVSHDCPSTILTTMHYHVSITLPLSFL